MITPSNVTLLTKGISSPLHFISRLSIAKMFELRGSTLGEYLHLNKIAFDFPTLSRSLLWANQFEIMTRSSSNSLITEWMVAPAQ